MLTILFPGYRHGNWKVLYDSIEQSMNGQEFEVIGVGPPIPENLKGEIASLTHLRFIPDYGSPSRCAQIALVEAKGEIFTWCSDDGVFLGNGLSEAYDLLTGLPENDGVCIRYMEGGNTPDDSYWTARTHRDLQIPGVKDNFKIAPLGMYYTDKVRSIGGWDCSYEHLNMGNHDLAFRLQNNGGVIHLSPSIMFTCTWSAPQADWAPVGNAHRENDSPLFSFMYSVERTDRLSLDINNWKNSPARWVRRFGVA